VSPIGAFCTVVVLGVLVMSAYPLLVVLGVGIIGLALTAGAIAIVARLMS
jgi:hypothetical protein